MNEEVKGPMDAFVHANTLLAEMRPRLGVKGDNSLTPMRRERKKLPEKCPVLNEEDGSCKDHSDRICDNPLWYVTCPPYMKRLKEAIKNSE